MTAVEPGTAQVTSATGENGEEFSQQLSRRYDLLTQLNCLNSATRRVPTEILTEMFRLAACVPDPREPQLCYVHLKKLLRIGGVCTHWRNVAWNAPQLWRTSLLTPIPWPTGGPKGDERAAVPSWLISCIWHNCQGNGISIRVDLADGRLKKMKILLENLARLQSIRVVFRSRSGGDEVPEWNYLSELFKACEDTSMQLRELWVNWPYEPFVCGLPLLPWGDPYPRVQLKYRLHVLPWRIPLAQLTVLRLTHVPVDQCIYLLLQAQSLVEFGCSIPSPSSHLYPISSYPASRFPADLQKIKHLMWHSTDEEWNLFFYRSIRFPNLERLILGPMTNPKSNLPSGHMLCSTFLPRFGNSLVALELIGMRARDFDSIDYFSSLRTNGTTFDALERLFFVLADRPGRDIERWLDALTFDSGRNLLPRLKILHILRNLHFDVDISKDVPARKLRRFLESRSRHRKANRGGEGNGSEIGCVEFERLILEIPCNDSEKKLFEELEAEGHVIEVVLRR